NTESKDQGDRRLGNILRSAPLDNLSRGQPAGFPRRTAVGEESPRMACLRPAPSTLADRLPRFGVEFPTHRKGQRRECSQMKFFPVNPSSGQTLSADLSQPQPPPKLLGDSRSQEWRFRSIFRPRFMDQLVIQNLHVSIGEQEIIRGLSLSVP